MLPENSLHPRAKRKSNLQICCKYLEKKEDRVRSMKEGAPTEEALGGTSQQSGQASKILARQPDHPISGAVWQLPTHGQVGGQEPHRAQLSLIIPQASTGAERCLTHSSRVLTHIRVTIPFLTWLAHSPVSRQAGAPGSGGLGYWTTRQGWS